MLTIRRADERGHADHGWLNTYHTFSFASYRDPRHMHFRALRVMNEDIVAPGQGFGTHPHANMEIVTYVLEGALEHRDSMGNGAVLRPGEFQRMSAGTGITHSEFNPSPSEPVHLYQIWLFPLHEGIEPSYEQKYFPEAERLNRLRLVASPDAAEGSLRIYQDARIFLGTLRPGHAASHALAPRRHAWVQVLRGSVTVDGEPLVAGDGAAIAGDGGDKPELVQIAASKSPAPEGAEVMLFDLA